MKWRPRPVDLGTGAVLVVILVASGFLVTGGPTEQTSGEPTPAAPPSAGSSPGTGAGNQPGEEPGGKPGKDGRDDVEIEDVPGSGSGMEIVMPGDAVEAPAFSSALDVTISSFNVLGTSHTVPGGTHRNRGYAPGATRARWAAQLLAARGVDIVGFQELERDQAATVRSALPGYDMFPGPQRRTHKSSNSIMWNAEEWEAVQTSLIGIPYFRGNIVDMPYVRLRHRATGTDLWVANFHNPASSKRRGNNQPHRLEATRRQIRLANTLRSQTGLPVIFTGDFNERESYFCRLVGGTELESSFGGTVVGGSCSPPPDSRIDWIFATPELSWLSSVRERSGTISRITDHPIVLAEARLTVVDQEAVEEARRGLERLEESQ
jgi:endonuclease/exonuclease/phosphatase family metal-dependent hydrolase